LLDLRYFSKYMSRLGKKPIEIPEGIEVTTSDSIITVKGKMGTLTVPILPFIKAEAKDKAMTFEVLGDNHQGLINLGTIASLFKNALVGLETGYAKSLKIEGVGYKVAVEGKNLSFNVGFSHPVKFIVPEGIKAEVDKNTIKISGIDKYLVGQTAANIRKIKKPEPYKGKGIRYENEVVRRKAGKKVGASAA